MRDKRDKALDWQRRLFPDCATLPEICMALRMMVNGAGEPARVAGWPEYQAFEREVVAMLRERLRNWQPSMCERDAAVDAAVKALVEATLVEVAHYLGDA